MLGRQHRMVAGRAVSGDSGQGRVDSTDETGSFSGSASIRRHHVSHRVPSHDSRKPPASHVRLCPDEEIFLRVGYGANAGWAHWQHPLASRSP